LILHRKYKINAAQIRKCEQVRENLLRPVRQRSRPMIPALVVIAVLVLVHLAAAVVATRVIAARIEEQNPPGGVFVPVTGGHLHLYDLAPPAPAQ